jgi:hypothetical protein
MEIREFTGNRRNLLDLLLLADEQFEMVEKYLDRGRMFVLEDVGEIRAECLVTDEGSGVLEIKNIAVKPQYQGKGYGKALIDFIVSSYCKEYDFIQVGTGDSPLTVPFYEKCGFERHHVIKDFFTENYDHPIIEAGVQLRDMVVLRRPLKQ